MFTTVILTVPSLFRVDEIDNTLDSPFKFLIPVSPTIMFVSVRIPVAAINLTFLVNSPYPIFLVLSVMYEVLFSFIALFLHPMLAINLVFSF